MATIEETVLLRRTDSTGNTRIMYPVTTAENIVGAEPFIVTVTLTTDTDGEISCTADKTWDEIQEAFVAGRNCFVKNLQSYYGDPSHCYPIIEVTVDTGYGTLKTITFGMSYPSALIEFTVLKSNEWSVSLLDESEYTQEKLTGAQGQMVGFDADGNAVAQDIPDTDVIVTASSTDGATYTATVDGMDSLVVGKELTIIPDYTSTSVSPTLNVNGLGAKTLRCAVSSNNATTTTATSASWLYSGKPVKVRYNGSFWVTDIVRPYASDLYGTVPISQGGTGATTAAAALTNLGLTMESWTFELEDGTTVTKSVVVSA